MDYKNTLKISQDIYNHLPLDQINLDLNMEEKDSQIMVTLPPYVELKDSSDWQSVAKQLKKEDSNCLYVHIPFCTGICTYCSYVRKKENNIEKYDIYLDALEKECHLQIDRFGFKPKVDSVYIGGGTPTILTYDQLARLCNIIKNNYIVPADVEFTLEGCPETVNIEKLDISSKFGINRVSLGVESFQDDILKYVNRRHRQKDTLEKLKQIQTSKIKNLDIDLINNLPYSTYETTYNDAMIALKTGIPSVTLYHFHNKPKSITRKKNKSPKENEQILKHVIFDTVMKSNGFWQDNYDKYVRDNIIFEHQVQKWSKQINMLTLGVGCYGFIENTQFFMTRSLSQYYKEIHENKLPMIKSKKLLSHQVLLRNFIMDIKIANTNFNIDQLENKQILLQKAEPLASLGLIDIQQNHIVIKEKGKYFVDYIQRYFYKNLWQ